jgi:aspartate racemase
MSLTLGVLGVDPPAGAAFLARLQALTPVGSARDHIRVLADINPGAAPTSAPGGAGPILAEMAGALRGAGADVLAIASHSAHAWADLIQRASGLPLIDMIKLGAVAACEAGALRVGVLGTRGSLRLYREYLAAQGLGMVSLSAPDQEALAAVLELIAVGERGVAVEGELARLADQLAADGAEAVIAGAAELPLAATARDFPLPLIDPLDLLAERCVAVCLGTEAVPAVMGV